LETNRIKMSKIIQQFKKLQSQKLNTEGLKPDVHFSELLRAGCTADEIRIAVQSGKLMWRLDYSGNLFLPESLENQK
jgi:hypothetical protein